MRNVNLAVAATVAILESNRGVDGFSAAPISTKVHHTIDNRITRCDATLSANAESVLSGVVLDQISQGELSAKEYAEMFGLGDSEAGFNGLFSAIRNSGIACGFKGYPFVLRNDEITKALNMDASPFEGFFTIDDLEQALEDDFLDAARGSTDNRKGWKVRFRGFEVEGSREKVKWNLEQILTSAFKNMPFLCCRLCCPKPSSQ